MKELAEDLFTTHSYAFFVQLTDVSMQDSDPTNYERRQQVKDMASFKKALQVWSGMQTVID